MTTRFDGTLTSWNDDRGFGFISSAMSAERVFVHISAFPPGSLRPQLGSQLTFDIEHVDNKIRATRVRPAGGRQGEGRPRRSSDARRSPDARRSASPHGHARHRSGAVDYVIIVAFIAGYIAVNALWPLPLWLAAAYLGASLVSFVVYAVDKSAATNGRWRVSENTLLFLGVIGGWPGAIIAQQTLRHKTKKASFRSAFWVTVALNLIVFAVFATPLFGAIVELLEHPLP